MFRSSLRRWSLLLLLSFSLTLLPANAATIKAGASCTKIGVIQKVGTTTYQCVLNGSKKIWTKKSATPTASPSATPKPSATPMQSVSPSPTAAASPSVTPTPTPIATPTPTATPTPNPTLTVTPSPTSTTKSLTIYQGGGGAAPGGKKSAELNFTPVTAAADVNLKLWIYDPENTSRSLNSPGIFYKKSDGNWTFIGANSDGTVYVKLPQGDYFLDTVEPGGNTTKYARKTYSLSINESGVVTFLGLSANSLGYFNLTIDLRATAATFTPKNQCQLLGQDSNTGMNSGFPHRSERLPTIGIIKALIIPVDFPDVIATGNPAETYYEMASGMDNFYRKVSDGRVSFEFQILSNYLRMNFASTKYNLGTWSGGDALGYWKASIAAADPYVDYSKFDVVYVLSPRNIPWASMAYGPAFPMKVETDDGLVFNGAISGADAWNNIPGAPWKWISHETGHLFGLHDLYTVSPQAPTFGSWDLMANNWSIEAIELDSWNRYITNWLDENQIDCLSTDAISASPISRQLIPLVQNGLGQKAQFIRLSASKILVAEYRVTGGLDNIPKANEGVLVYTVDMTIPSIKGGWSTQRRAGSVRDDFTDAALKTGDTVQVSGVTISVASLSSTSAEIRITKA